MHSAHRVWVKASSCPQLEANKALAFQPPLGMTRL